MNPPIRCDAEDAGTFTVYLLDPSEPRQAVWHVTGVSVPLSRRDELELRWAAERSGLVSERDLLRDVRAALRDAMKQRPTKERVRARALTDQPRNPERSTRPASGQPVAKALRRRKEEKHDDD